MRDTETVFEDKHRIFLQAMMNKPVMNSKEVAQMVAIVRERTNDFRELDKKQLMEYIRQLTIDINNKLEPLKMKIFKLCDEESRSRDSYFILVTTSDRSRDSTKLSKNAMVEFTPAELEWIKGIVDAIMNSDTREITNLRAINISRNIQTQRFSVSGANDALNKMIREKWLVENGDADESSDDDDEEDEESVAKKLILSPRFIAEMQDFLRDNYEEFLFTCGVRTCGKIVIRPSLCRECKTAFHLSCYESQKEKKCLKCGKTGTVFRIGSERLGDTFQRKRKMISDDEKED